MTTATRRGAPLIAVTSILLAVGCTGNDNAGTTLEAPSSVAEIVEATLAGVGLEVAYRVLPREGEPYALLRAVTTLDTATNNAYQTAFGRMGGEFEAGGLPPEIELGENWVIDGVGYTREPGEETARRASGGLAGLLGADDVAPDTGDAVVVLTEMLDGWPGATVSDDEVVDGVLTNRSRLERDGGDVLDVWIDAHGRLVKVERRTDRSPLLLVELVFRVLDGPPEIPRLPPIEA